MRKSQKQMTLGELIASLKRKDQDANVTFGLDRLRPSCVSSYRGYYEDLTIGFARGGEISVAELLVLLEDAVGKTFSGYKGGAYRMHEDTAIWAANPGNTSSMAIVDAVEVGNKIWLKTEMIP